MLKYLGLRWWLALTVAPVACVKPPASSSGVDINAYAEDVTRYRTTMVDSMQYTLDTLRKDNTVVDANEGITTPVSPTHDQTLAINTLMDTVAAYNARIPYVEGFTVLVYSGTNRDEFALAQREVEELGLTARITYTRPNFKVKVGRFTDQLEARRTHLLLKQHFRSAIIVPERIVLQE